MKDREVSKFIETISYSINMGTCKGELHHVIEMMSWELLLRLDG
ncbi:MAG: hypothetical protein WKI46_04730 [Aquificaceae bacterium]